MLEDPLLKKAFDFAQLSLVGKTRYSGEAFEEHGMKAAKTLEEFHIKDPTTLAVAILHHVVSDGAATYDDIQKEFGEEISSMLKTFDSLKVIKLTNQSENLFAENLRRMFLTMARDLRIVLIKLADILDNLKTLEHLSEDKQVEVARETLEIFAPLAERLGMAEMSGQMQDLAFSYLYPQDCEKVMKIIQANAKELDNVMLKIKAKLTLELTKQIKDFKIENRIKRIYSLYTKLKRLEIGWDISKVADLIAFRILVEDIEDCYKVLGIIHKFWQPYPDGFSDYIANPKLNGYRSLHTKVIGPDGKPFEIQIKTFKMHEENEFGVAAHWSYAEAKTSGVSDQKLSSGVKVAANKLEWVKRLSSWQEEITDNEEFLKSVRTDFFGERIYVFTPKGDVKDLPDGATPVDFAYAIHSDLGDRATGAKVNGKLISLDTKLKNSDVCEIILAKDLQKKPNRDWLSFVVTSMARKKIKRTIDL